MTENSAGSDWRTNTREQVFRTLKHIPGSGTDVEPGSTPEGAGSARPARPDRISQ